MNLTKICIISTSLWFFSLESRAEDKTSSPVTESDVNPDEAPLSKKMERPDQEKSLLENVVFVPAIFYTPETSFGLGLGVVHVFKEDEEQKNAKTSQFIPLLIYTTNRQTILRLYMKNYFVNDTYFSDMSLSYNDYPDKYYGIGSDTELKDEEKFTEEYGRVTWDMMRRIVEDVYIGPAFRYEHFLLKDKEEDGTLRLNPPIGANSGKTNGIGLRFFFDHRDNDFNTRKGYFYEYLFLRYLVDLGSSQQFSHQFIRFRYFLPLWTKTTLGTDFRYEGNYGEVPLRHLAQLGGQYNLRGYFLGRFRDRQSLFSQVEIKQQMNLHWSYVIFAGAGEVADRLKKFNNEDIKIAQGFGFRYLVKPEKRVGYRLDFAFGEDSRAVYFGVGDAF